MNRFSKAMLAAISLSVIPLGACQHLVIDADRIIKSHIDLPEMVGIVAGGGTTLPRSPTS